MFKALFIALAAAAGWTTVSGQDTAPAVPTSPLPMLSLQAPDAPQEPAGLPPAAPVVVRLKQDAPGQPFSVHKPGEPKRLQKQRIKKAPAPTHFKAKTKAKIKIQAKGKTDVVASQLALVVQGTNLPNSLFQDDRKALLEQIQALQAENLRLQESVQTRLMQGRHRNDQQAAMQAEHHALQEAQRALKKEQQGSAFAMARQQAAEARALFSKAKAQTKQAKQAKRHQVRVLRQNDHAETYRVALKAATGERKVTMDLHKEHLREALRNLEQTLQNLESQEDQPHMVHLQRILEQCGLDADGDRVEIEVLMEHLENLQDSIEDNHELQIDEIEVRMEDLEDMIDDQAMGDLKILFKDMDGQAFTVDHLESLEGLAARVGLENLTELDSLENLQGYLAIDKLQNLNNLADLEALGALGKIRFFTGEGSCDDRFPDCSDRSDCSDQDDCSDKDNRCDSKGNSTIDRLLHKTSCSGNIRFETKGGQGLQFFSNGDGQTRVFLGDGDSKSEGQTFFIRGNCDSEDSGPSTRIKVEPGKNHFGWTKTITTDALPHDGPRGWTTSTTTDSTKHIWNTSHSSTGTAPHSCGTSVIKIENQGGQIFIDTKNGRTRINCETQSDCTPAPSAPHRLFFSTDTPPAPACPPSECKNLPDCDAPDAPDSGVSMRVYPNRTAPIISSFPVVDNREFPQVVREYAFASQPHTKDATLVELERMLNEVLREVDALQVEVNRVRTAVHKNQIR